MHAWIQGLIFTARHMLLSNALPRKKPLVTRHPKFPAHTALPLAVTQSSPNVSMGRQRRRQWRATYGGLPLA